MKPITITGNYLCAYSAGMRRCCALGLLALLVVGSGQTCDNTGLPNLLAPGEQVAGYVVDEHQVGPAAQDDPSAPQTADAPPTDQDASTTEQADSSPINSEESSGIDHLNNRQTDGFVPGRLLVKFKTGVQDDKKREVFNKHQVNEVDSIPEIGVHVLQLPPQASETAVAKAMHGRPEIEFAELDAIREITATPNDPKYWIQTHLPQINAPAAWDITPGSAGVTVAVVDTGVESTHPDLAAKLVPGRDVYLDSSDTTDLQGHGTAVAGLAAAAGNDAVGVASPAWYSKIMPIRVTDGTSAMTSDSILAKAIMYAADQNVRIVNASWGLCSPSPTLDAAAQYLWQRKGVVFFGSGNAGTLCTAADDPWIGLIGATDAADVLAPFSGYGDAVDLVAPGMSLYGPCKGGGYAYGTGTSFSTALVSGVAALVVSANPTLTSQQIMDILKTSARDLGAPGRDPYYGWGRVDAGAAVQMACSMPGSVTGCNQTAPPPDTTPPTVTISSPAAEASVSGTVTIQVSGTDNVAVASVGVTIDGASLGTDTTSPYAFAWDSSAAAAGTHTILATGRDAAGNTASTQISVNIVRDNTPPAVAFSSPAAGATVSGTITIQVAASDNIGVYAVNLAVDGAAINTDTASPYSFSWNTATVLDGVHTLSATASDVSGNTSTVQLSVSVSNVVVPPPSDTIGPTITITSPANGSTLSGNNVSVKVSASDNVGVSKVVLYVDGKQVAASTSAPFSMTWNARKAARGAHTLVCKTYDAAGNVGTSPAITVYR